MGAFILMVHLRTIPEKREKFMEIALENAAAARSTEPGCRQFDVLVDPEDPNRVSFYEVYDSKDAFETHRQTAHFKKYLENAVPLLVSRELTFFNRIVP
ncbi:MAG: (4S)-4-hydroxy-5-phosphonooxypentane-2,3-dione isomerase [Deltaproteobacteria bacterium]|nr:(4S)-4-hydroxy-5-phosphonooxypentane-2,3-dione isomerase [Deltaproteobacteria bacterium]